MEEHTMLQQYCSEGANAAQQSQIQVESDSLVNTEELTERKHTSDLVDKKMDDTTETVQLETSNIATMTAAGNKEASREEKVATVIDELKVTNKAVSSQVFPITPTAANSASSQGSETPVTPSRTQTVRYSDILENSLGEGCLSHVQCDKTCANYEQQLEQLRAALVQKDNIILLLQRENSILEKEKQAFRKEKEVANREKESTVIKFAMKEKLLIDAKKEREVVEKQLSEAKKEVKNVSIRFQALYEEKSRMTYIMDEKCNEVRKYQRECEKLKTDNGHLESKLKYHVNKLNMEIEAKVALEKKLEEERTAPSKLEEKANEKLKMEYEASTILLKHEIKNKIEIIENLSRENSKASEMLKHLQEQLSKEVAEKIQLTANMELLQEEHNSVQNSYSEEMLNSAKLRGQLEELQVLRTQNTLNEENISNLNVTIIELEEKLQDNMHDLEHLHSKEKELLTLNKEISESIVSLQNEICLLKAKAQGIEAENDILRKEKLVYDKKYAALEKQLKSEEEQKTGERLLLAKHLSEKTKLYEMTKLKLDNLLGDFEATKHKHATIVKEMQRELQKYKKSMEQTNSQQANSVYRNCTYCQNGHESVEAAAHSRASSQCSSRRPSETSESETVTSNVTAIQKDLQGPSNKNLVDRILRLQQASARQTEKIDFLENHTLSLVAELQKKSKVVQYYMMRDQAGALTSSKSDQNKSELAKYGNGVMATIYSGIKGESKSMTLELSLEINKKLQAVLEDTLLKNITLKENLDVLGLEVDNLTRKLRQLETKD